MPRRNGMKEKLGMLVYEKPELNKKILDMKKSLDEVDAILKKYKGKMERL